MATNYKDPKIAFSNALTKGVFSLDAQSPTYVGHWMYMYSDTQGDAFKHIATRKYLWVQS